MQAQPTSPFSALAHPNANGAEMEVGESQIAVARRAHARILAKLSAIKPIALKGDTEAQTEVLGLTAQLATVAEEIASLKSPADQVKMYTRALVDKQETLGKAEETLAEWRLSLVSLETEVRGRKHDVD